MSITAEKIEDGFIKRWFKNSFLFIFNNPFLSVYYSLTVLFLGFLIYATPLHRASNVMFILLGSYLTFICFNIQYEASYKKVGIVEYLKLLKTSGEEFFKYVTTDGISTMIKFLLVIACVGFFDYLRESREFPIINKDMKIYYEDVILAGLLGCAWCVILVETVFGKIFSNSIHRVPFSCDFILQKFAGFSTEGSVKEAILGLLKEADKINYNVHLIFNYWIYIFVILGGILARIHPTITLAIFLIIPIFYFQAGKETFLDQGNRKHQDQKQEENSADTVPDPSGA